MLSDLTTTFAKVSPFTCVDRFKNELEEITYDIDRGGKGCQEAIGAKHCTNRKSVGQWGKAYK